MTTLPRSAPTPGVSWRGTGVIERRSVQWTARQQLGDRASGPPLAARRELLIGVEYRRDRAVEPAARHDDHDGGRGDENVERWRFDDRVTATSQAPNAA